MDIVEYFKHSKEVHEAIGEARGEAIGEARGEARGKAIGEARGEARGKAIGEAKAEKRILKIAKGLLQNSTMSIQEIENLTKFDVLRLKKLKNDQ